MSVGCTMPLSLSLETWLQDYIESRAVTTMPRTQGLTP